LPLFPSAALKPGARVSDGQRDRTFAVTTLERAQTKDLPLAFVELPPFPAVALKALRVMSRRDSRLRELHDLIRSDQAFSGEVLRLVNSPLFPFPAPITSTLQAAMLLGFERVQALAVTIGIRAYLRDALEIPLLRNCWHHSLATAIIAEQLSRVVVSDKDALYTAGIMHDIGRLALAVCRRTDYADFLRSTESVPCDILAREQELFGIDHCAAGRALVIAWNLPEEFQVITARHHQPGNGKWDVLAIIQLACNLADALGFTVAHQLNTPGYSELRETLPAADRQYLPEDRDELAARIKADVDVLEHS
jgi:putative nucleotidyltransferase with HDIG domain